MLLSGDDVQKQLDNRKVKIEEELISLRAEVQYCCFGYLFVL